MIKEFCGELCLLTLPQNLFNVCSEFTIKAVVSAGRITQESQEPRTEMMTPTVTNQYDHGPTVCIMIAAMVVPSVPLEA